MRLSPLHSGLFLVLALGFSVGPGSPLLRSAQAEPRASARGHTAKKAANPPKPSTPTTPADEPPEPEEVPSAGESGVKAAGTSTKASPSSTVKGVKEEESSGGVKTYEFGAVEVEGRLRSPQILYFLRRVRAEFDARGLGHRSFLLELADTRNDAAFR